MDVLDLLGELAKVVPELLPHPHEGRLRPVWLELARHLLRNYLGQGRWVVDHRLLRLAVVAEEAIGW